MSLGPHAFYIIVSYAVAAAALGGMGAWILYSHCRARKDAAP